MWLREVLCAAALVLARGTEGDEAAYDVHPKLAAANVVAVKTEGADGCVQPKDLLGKGDDCNAMDLVAGHVQFNHKRLPAMIIDVGTPGECRWWAVAVNEGELLACELGVHSENGNLEVAPAGCGTAADYSDESDDKLAELRNNTDNVSELINTDNVSELNTSNTSNTSNTAYASTQACVSDLRAVPRVGKKPQTHGFTLTLRIACDVVEAFCALKEKLDQLAQRVAETAAAGAIGVMNTCGAAPEKQDGRRLAAQQADVDITVFGNGDDGDLATPVTPADVDKMMKELGLDGDTAEVKTPGDRRVADDGVADDGGLPEGGMPKDKPPGITASMVADPDEAEALARAKGPPPVQAPPPPPPDRLWSASAPSPSGHSPSTFAWVAAGAVAVPLAVVAAWAVGRRSAPVGQELAQLVGEEGDELCSE